MKFSKYIVAALLISSTSLIARDALPDWAVQTLKLDEDTRPEFKAAVKERWHQLEAEKLRNQAQYHQNQAQWNHVPTPLERFIRRAEGVGFFLKALSATSRGLNALMWLVSGRNY